MECDLESESTQSLRVAEGCPSSRRSIARPGSVSSVELALETQGAFPRIVFCGVFVLLAVAIVALLNVSNVTVPAVPTVDPLVPAGSPVETGCWSAPAGAGYRVFDARLASRCAERELENLY